MQQELTASQEECVLHTEKASQLEEALSQVQSEHAICMSQKALEQLVAALKEESRQRQDELEEAAKAANDAGEEARKAKIARQTTQTELQQEAELVQQELNAVLSQQQHEQSAAQRAEAEASNLRLEMEEVQKVSESAKAREGQLEAKVLKMQEDMFLSEGKHKEVQFEGRLEQHKFEEECLMLKKLLATSEQALEVKKDLADWQDPFSRDHSNVATRQAVSATLEEQLNESRQWFLQLKSELQRKLEAIEVANAGSASNLQKVSQVEALLRNFNSEYQKDVKGHLSTLTEKFDKSRQELAEAERKETEIKKEVEEAVRGRRSAEEVAESLQAQLRQKDDADEEARKSQSEKQGLQTDQTELEKKTELMRQELNAVQDESVMWQQKLSSSENRMAFARSRFQKAIASEEEMESRETELKEEVQEAVGEQRLAEEAVNSLQARLEQKENELRQRQYKLKETAKAATDAEEETQKLRLELEAKIALQTEKTELEVYAKLMQEELNAAQAEQVALRHTIERTETGEGHLRQELAAEKAEKSAECKRCPASKGEAAQTTLADEKMRNLEEALSKARSQHDKELAASRGEIEALEQKGFQKSFYRTLSQAQDKELAALREQIDVLERREQKRQSAEARWERLGALGRQGLIFDESNPIDKPSTLIHLFERNAAATRNLHYMPFELSIGGCALASSLCA